MEISKEFLTEIEKNCLGKNLQDIILCYIIQNWLLLNYLQRVVVEKVLNLVIIYKRHQCQDRSDQFLLYVREEGRVGKNEFVQAIFIGFSFFKKQTEFLITLTGASVARTRGITNHGALSIDEYV